MSKELDEKREKLKRLEEVLIPSLETSIADGKRDVEILSQTVSIEEAHEIYLRGDATQEEYENYVRDRGALEVSVRWLPEYVSRLDTMKREAHILKVGIKDLEQQEKKEGKKSSGGKERIRLAVIYLVACAVFTGLFGWFLSLLPPKVGFIEACKGVFWLFSAPMVVCAVMELLINIPDGLPPWVGFSLYYGTAILYMVPEWLGWYIPKFDRVLLGAAVCGVICYFAYKQIPHD